MDSCDSWNTKGLSPEALPLLELILPAMDEVPAPGFCKEVDGDEFSSCLSDETLSHIESTAVSSSTSPAMFARMVGSPRSSDVHPGIGSSKPVQEERLSSLGPHETRGGCTVVAKRVKLDQDGASLKLAQLSQSQVPKLSEKITALQQLVSPFGKTDAASVLLEAIGYIKFLQDQVHVLSSPYMKANLSDKQGSVVGMDLRSRGLCLVPISCTTNVANSNGADYWISGISGCSR